MSLVDDVYRTLDYSVRREHVDAVLSALDEHAVVVDRSSIPSAYFHSRYGVPTVRFVPPRSSRVQKEIPFTKSHLSTRRALTALREALAVYSVLTSAAEYPLLLHRKAKANYLRQHLQEQSVAEGGSPALVSGVL